MANDDFRPEARKLAKDKSLWNELHYEIDRILWEEWDPIGLNHHPQSRDEYDRYAMGVVIRLQHGAAEPEIADYLWHCQTFAIGSDRPERAHTDAVAAKCIAAAINLQ
jgi:hypothetical protein